MTARETVRVAAVQAAPAFLDLDAAIAKAVVLIAEAARNGARLADRLGYSRYWVAGHHATPDDFPEQRAAMTRRSPPSSIFA